jgi:predicted phosphodiesterase
VLSDIHGNLPALQAVLADVEEAGADIVVFGGDVAAGPMPVETRRPGGCRSHTHMQFDRRVAGRRMVNAGSVGMPHAKQPGAY